MPDLVAKCVARKVFTLTHNAPSNREFILATNSHADAFTGQELDSLDLGDAMGYWMNYLESGYWSGDNDTGNAVIPMPGGFLVTITYDWDAFEWENTPTDPNYLSDSRGDGYHDE